MWKKSEGVGEWAAGAVSQLIRREEGEGVNKKFLCQFVVVGRGERGKL